MYVLLSGRPRNLIVARARDDGSERVRQFCYQAPANCDHGWGHKSAPTAGSSCIRYFRRQSVEGTLRPADPLSAGHLQFGFSLWQESSLDSGYSTRFKSYLTGHHRRRDASTESLGFQVVQLMPLVDQGKWRPATPGSSPFDRPRTSAIPLDTAELRHLDFRSLGARSRCVVMLRMTHVCPAHEPQQPRIAAGLRAVACWLAWR